MAELRAPWRRCGRRGPHYWDTQQGPEGWGAGSVDPRGPTLILIQRVSRPPRSLEVSAAPPWGLSCPTPFLRTVTQAEVSTNFTGIEVSQLEELTACLQTGCLQESSPSLVCRLPVAPPPLAGGTLVGWGRQGVGETRSFRGQGGSLKGQGRRVSGYLNSKERWLSPRACAGGSRQDSEIDH